MLSFDSFPFSKQTDVLAGEPSADNVNAPIFGGSRRKGSHVVPLPTVWPVLCEDFLRVRVDFDLPAGFKASGSFESKFNSSYACEQAANG